MLRSPAIALATLALTASTTLANAATEISWWHGMGGKNQEVINEISRRFNDAQASCHLTPVSKGTYEEALSSGIAAFRSGSQPNILQVFDAGAATIMNAPGAVVPAEDLITKAGYGFERDAFINGVRYFYADAQGKFVGMPFNSSAPIMYTNTEAFEKAGVQPPKTWEEFEAVAPKLKDAGYIPMTASQLTWQFFENFFSRNDIQMASNDNGYAATEGTTLNATDPQLVMMFTKLKEWHDKGWYGFYGAGWSDNQAPFEQNKVAMWIGSSGSFGGLSKTATMPFSATFLPYWGAIQGAGTNSFIGGAALFAMSGKPEAENKCTADFFQYLTSPEVQVYWHEETGYVPITKAAYAMAKEQGWYKDHPVAEVGIQQLSLPGGEWSKGYRLGFYPQIRSVEEREFNRIFSGETSVEDAFKAIKTEGDQLLSRFARTAG